MENSPQKVGCIFMTNELMAFTFYFWTPLPPEQHLHHQFIILICSLPHCFFYISFSAHTDRGPCTPSAHARWCHSSNHERERKFTGARVYKVTFEQRTIWIDPGQSAQLDPGLGLAKMLFLVATTVVVKKWYGFI